MATPFYTTAWVRKFEVLVLGLEWTFEKINHTNSLIHVWHWAVEGSQSSPREPTEKDMQTKITYIEGQLCIDKTSISPNLLKSNITSPHCVEATLFFIVTKFIIKQLYCTKADMRFNQAYLLLTTFSGFIHWHNLKSTTAHFSCSVHFWFKWSSWHSSQTCP